MGCTCGLARGARLGRVLDAGCGSAVPYHRDAVYAVLVLLIVNACSDSLFFVLDVISDPLDSFMWCGKVQNSLLGQACVALPLCG